MSTEISGQFIAVSRLAMGVDGELPVLKAYPDGYSEAYLYIRWSVFEKKLTTFSC